MATELATDVIAQFATNIDAITSESPSSGFQRSGYRLTLGQEPDAAIDGLYFIKCTELLPPAQTFGNTETICRAHINVEVGYYRGGGDAGGGDRQTVMRNAADDCQKLMDVLANPTNYNQGTTGIREIRPLGAEMVVDRAHAEVWVARFWVEWRSDLVTA